VTETPPTEPRTTAGAVPILDRIDSEHDQMRYWLDEVTSLVNHLDENGWDTWARDHARSVIDFFAHTARQHHLDVDRQVLPLVAGRGDETIDTHVDQLRQGHGWIDECWSELVAQLKPVAEGFGGYDIDTLRQAASVYDSLLREHLDREKTLLYPAARASAEGPIRGESSRLAENSTTSGSTLG
jgi:hemerythrin-like domain-containing protein